MTPGTARLSDYRDAGYGIGAPALPSLATLMVATVRAISMCERAAKGRQAGN